MENKIDSEFIDFINGLYRRLSDVDLKTGDPEMVIKETFAITEDLNRAYAANSRFSFSDGHKRMVYVIDDLDMNPEEAKTFRDFRWYAKRVCEGKAEHGQSKAIACVKSAAELLKRVSGIDIPEEISDKYTGMELTPLGYSLPKDFERIPWVKCVVLEKYPLETNADGVKSYKLHCVSEGALSTFTIIFRDSKYSTKLSACYDGIKKFGSIGIEEFRKVPGYDFLYESTSETELLVEPDYLFEASDIRNGLIGKKISPESFLVDKFVPSETGKAAFKGILVNEILDKIITDPKTSFEEAFRSCLNEHGLEVAKFGIELIEEIKQDIFSTHFDSLVEFAKLERNRVAILEPTFISPKYGLMGRLDVLSEDKRNPKRKSIYELKSGKPPNAPWIWPQDEVQVECYNMLLKSAYGEDRTGPSYVFYSRKNENPGENVRYVADSSSLKGKVIEIRNRIYNQISKLSSDDYTPLDFINDSNFEDAPVFVKESVERFRRNYDGASEIEREYYQQFLGMVLRELRHAKIGNDNEYGKAPTSPYSSSWLETLERRISMGTAVSGIKKTHYDAENSEGEFEVERPMDCDDFREGDIIILYHKHETSGSPEHGPVLKGTLVEKDNGRLKIAFKNKLLTDEYFMPSAEWVMNHDVSESGYWAQIGGLFDFLEAEKEKKELILGLRTPKTKNETVWKFDDLNANQEEILSDALNAEDYYLLQGPPGTGKTSLMLTRLVSKMNNPGSPGIVIVAFTNRAVDEICQNLTKNKIDFVRFGSKRTNDPLLFSNATKGMDGNEIREFLKARKVYVSTVSTMYSKIRTLSSLTELGTIIVDEASQLTEPQLAGLVVQFKKFILIGDQNQLPAVVTQSEENTTLKNETLARIGFSDLRMSMFERLYEKCKEKGWGHCHGMLETHYRMHKDIEVLINDFYDNQLKTGTTRQNEPLVNNHDIGGSVDPISKLLMENRVVFIESPQKAGDEEVRRTKCLVNSIIRLSGKNMGKSTLGIISPWRRQNEKIRKSLSDTPETEKVAVDTIERFQGSEKDTVIFSLAIEDNFQLKRISSENSDGTVDRKFNVALSRAKERIIILGNSKSLSRNPFYRKLLNSIRQNGRYIGQNEAENLFKKA